MAGRRSASSTSPPAAISGIHLGDNTGEAAADNVQLVFDARAPDADRRQLGSGSDAVRWRSARLGIGERRWRRWPRPIASAIARASRAS